MKQDQLLETMARVGYTLPKNRRSLQEAKVRLNPKTGTMWYMDRKERLWSEDKRENHFDVLDRSGEYLRISPEGAILGIKQSSIAYAH